MYLGSVRKLGFDNQVHDIRFVGDDWESPTLGAWGLGWEVWLNGMEVTQFTYFQQVGGLECHPVSGEITYGIERLAMGEATSRSEVINDTLTAIVKDIIALFLTVNQRTDRDDRTREFGTGAHAIIWRHVPALEGGAKE